MAKNSSTQLIKEVLLQFHRERGYKILESFPMISDDPTVLLVNATITPFKGLFIGTDVEQINFALIQKCFRLRGLNSIEEIGKNKNCSSYFEMFGSGIFHISYQEAIVYLLDLLRDLGLDPSKEYFVVPADHNFEKELKDKGVADEQIFILRENQIFWQEWKFGKGGPVGKGLTVVYAIGNVKPSSVEQMENDSENFLELLNLIYIFGKDQDGTTVSVSSPGFELGVGVERIATILQDCNGYQTDTIRPLVELIKDYFQKQKYQADEETIMICADHLRSSFMLLSEGLTPSNKGAGYVLRKLIRRMIENIWQSASEPVSVNDLAKVFFLKMIEMGCPTNQSVDTLIGFIQEEERALLKAFSRAKKVLNRKPDTSPSILRDTYGVSPEMLALMKKRKGVIHDKQ